MSFDRFLSDLKQQAVAAGVSQRALAEASPGLVYDQGIVNRDRGQRVFGQIFTEFAGRMAAISRMQQGQARIKTHAAAFARAEKEYGVPPAVIAAFGVLKAISAPTWAACRRCARWSHSPMTAAARRCLRRKPSPR
jgi:membrane-bound lytic murein transglycosylase B